MIHTYRVLFAMSDGQHFEYFVSAQDEQSALTYAQELCRVDDATVGCGGFQPHSCTIVHAGSPTAREYQRN